MAVVVPASFRYIGSVLDASGSSQFAPGRSIGGNENVDEISEMDALLDNATWCYCASNRGAVAQLVPYSQGAVANIISTASAVYVEACELTCDLGEGRKGLTITVDFGNDGGGIPIAVVKASAYRRDTGVLLSSGTVQTALARTVSTFQVTGITVREIYVVVELKATGGGNSTLWAIHLYEDAVVP